MNLQAQSENAEVQGTLKLLSTGQLLTLRFGKGETTKKVELALGQYKLTGTLSLVKNPNTKPGAPDMFLSLQLDVPGIVVEEIKPVVMVEEIKKEDVLPVVEIKKEEVVEVDKPKTKSKLSE